VSPRIIDVHAHYFPQPYLDLLASERGVKAGFGTEAVPGGFIIQTPGGRRGPQPAKYIDLSLRLADMDAQGVTMQALSLTVPMVYWADDAFSHDLSKAYNDSASAASEQYPDRFVGLATLPMLAPDRAIREVERASALPGIKGIYIGTNIEGRDLSDPLFEPIFARIAALDLPLFLHPIKPLGGARFKPYHLGNLIGNPTETATAAAHLIFGGVLDRHPDLQVVLPHAGGSLPILIGRYDHGSRVRQEMRHLPHLPSAYLRRFTYDTLTHSPQILRFLVEMVGADRIVLGSDYCADMGTEQPVQFVEQAGLDTCDQTLIFHDTAARLLRL
jgi:aminocarboxymuconate-semialdehyde decarboxylase